MRIALVIVTLSLAAAGCGGDAPPSNDEVAAGLAGSLVETRNWETEVTCLEAEDVEGGYACVAAGSVDVDVTCDQGACSYSYTATESDSAGKTREVPIRGSFALG